MTSQASYKSCTKCVLDTSTSQIKFDSSGVCNFCHNYDHAAEQSVNKPREVREKRTANRFKKNKIKKVKETNTIV